MEADRWAMKPARHPHDPRPEAQRIYERHVNFTLARAPVMPMPLPGEAEARERGGPWDIHRILAEIERVRPSVDAARKAWFEARRADMPPLGKAWAEAQRAAREPSESAGRPAKGTRTSLAHLSPEERRARKLAQTRESNRRIRAIQRIKDQ